MYRSNDVSIMKTQETWGARVYMLTEPTYTIAHELQLLCLVTREPPAASAGIQAEH